MSAKGGLWRYDHLAMTDTSVLFCGDPHGKFDHIVRVADRFPAVPIVLLGDLEPDRDLLVLLRSIEDRLYWIHGNHDTDAQDVANRVWNESAQKYSIHGKVVTLPNGVRLAGLGGVFRESVWHPDPAGARKGQPVFWSPEEHAKATPRQDRWRNGPHIRHWSSIYPSVVDALRADTCDVLVLHEAPGYHPYGVQELDVVAQDMGAKVVVHGHHHDSLDSSARWTAQGFKSFGVGLRGITTIDLHGEATPVVPGEIDEARRVRCS